MAITFVGSATGSVTNGGTCTVDLTGIAGLAENDIVIAFAVASAGVPAPPSGYTHIDDYNTASAKVSLSRKFQAASVDTSLSFWDTGGSGDSGTALAFAFRGVDMGSPLDVDVVEVTGTTNPSAITPTNDNCTVVILAADAGGEDVDIGTVTNYSTPVTTTSSDTQKTTIAAVYRILTGGGGSEENPGNWSGWTESSDSVVYLIALRAGSSATFRRRSGNIPFIAPHMGNLGLKVI